MCGGDFALSLTERFIESSYVKWHTATSHLFLTACKDGTIASSQFDRWLCQDYLYVQSFIRLIGATLAKAPTDDIGPLAKGITIVSAELEWFKGKAKERQIDLDTKDLSPPCSAYCSLMEDLHGAPYAVQLSAIWVMERAYHEAWSNLGTTDPGYQEFADRWGSLEYGQYVDALQAQADRALRAAPEHLEAARQVVEDIMELEVDFWNMAYVEM